MAKSALNVVGLDDALIPPLIVDLAQGIHRYSVIAERYGFSEGELLEYLRDNPAVRRLVRRHKASYESDEAVHKRIRLKAGLAVEETIEDMVALIRSETTPTGQKIDSFHKLSRAAGTDGGGSEGRAADGDGATRFNLNFIFSDGSRQQISLTDPTVGDSPRLAPPVLEHEPA
jgi:hypothetical protein